MGLYTEKTIKKVMGEIDNYALPSFQRKYEWKAKEVESLFDSILRGYPINTFLFWSVDSTTSGDFFDFLPITYDKKSSHNNKKIIQNQTYAVLDGQ